MGFLYMVFQWLTARRWLLAEEGQLYYDYMEGSACDALS